MAMMALHGPHLEAFGSLLPHSDFETLVDDAQAEMGRSITPVRQGQAGATPQLTLGAAQERGWLTAVALLGQDKGRIAQLCSHFDPSVMTSLPTAFKGASTQVLGDRDRKRASLMLIDRLLQEQPATGLDTLRSQLPSLRHKLETSQISVGDALEAMLPMVGATRILELAGPIIAAMGSPQVAPVQQLDLGHTGERVPAPNPFANPFSNASYPLAGAFHMPAAWMSSSFNTKPTSPPGGDATVSVAISAADRAAFKGHDAGGAAPKQVESPGLTMRLSSSAPTTTKQPRHNPPPAALDMAGSIPNETDPSQRMMMPAISHDGHAGVQSTHSALAAHPATEPVTAAPADPDSTPPNSTASHYISHQSPPTMPPAVAAVLSGPPAEVAASMHVTEPDTTPVDSTVSRRVRHPSPLRPRSETTSGLKMCSNPNCRTDRTPLWRRENDMTMCNACGLFYKARGYHRPRELVLQSQQSNRGSYGSGSVGTVRSGMTTPAGGGTPAVSGDLHITTSMAPGGSINQMNGGDTATSPPHQARYRRNPSPLQFRSVDSLGHSGDLRKRTSLPGADSGDEGGLSEGMTDGQYSSGGLAFRKSSRQVKKRRESVFEWFDGEAGLEGAGPPGGVGGPTNSGQYSMPGPSNSTGQQRTMLAAAVAAKASSKSKGSSRRKEVSSGAVNSDPSKEFSFGHTSHNLLDSATAVLPGRQHSLYGPACSTPRLPSGPMAAAFGADVTGGGEAGGMMANGADAGQASMVPGLGEVQGGGDQGMMVDEAGLPLDEQAAMKKARMMDLTIESDVAQVASVLLSLRHAVIQLAPPGMNGASAQEQLMHHHHHLEHEDSSGLDVMGADGAVDISMVHPGNKRGRPGYGMDMQVHKQPAMGRTKGPAGPRGSAKRSPGTGSGKGNSWSRSKSPGTSVAARPNVMCTNCTTTKTCLWRKDKETGAPLCNACGIYKNQNGVHRPVPGGHVLAQQQQQQQHLSNVALSVGVAPSITAPANPSQVTQMQPGSGAPGTASTLSGCASPSVTVGTGADAGTMPQASQHTGQHGFTTPGTASTLSGGASPALSMDTASARRSPARQRTAPSVTAVSGAASPSVTIGSTHPRIPGPAAGAPMVEGSPVTYQQQHGKGVPMRAAAPRQTGGHAAHQPAPQQQHRQSAQQQQQPFKGPSTGRPPLAPVGGPQRMLSAAGDAGAGAGSAPAAGIPMAMPPMQGGSGGQPPAGMFSMGMPPHVMGATMFPYYYPGSGPMAAAFNQQMMEYVGQHPAPGAPMQAQHGEAASSSVAQGTPASAGPAVGTPAGAAPPAAATGSQQPSGSAPAGSGSGLDHEKAGQQVLAGCIQLCQVLKEKEDRQRQGGPPATGAPQPGRASNPVVPQQSQQHHPAAQVAGPSEQQQGMHQQPSQGVAIMSGHPATGYFSSVFSPAGGPPPAGGPGSSAGGAQHPGGMPGYHHLSLMPMAPFAVSGPHMYMMGQPSGAPGPMGGPSGVGPMNPYCAMFRPPPPMQPPAQQL